MEGACRAAAGAGVARQRSGSRAKSATHRRLYDLDQKIALQGDALLLSDSQAAIKAVKKAEMTGKARTRELKLLMDEIERRSKNKLRVRLGWIRSHVGINGNERADTLSKKATLTESWRPGMIDSITEGGVKQLWSDARRRVREIFGYGKGKFARWDRHSRC